jgi:hypothetical protein
MCSSRTFLSKSFPKEGAKPGTFSQNAAAFPGQTESCPHKCAVMTIGYFFKV